MVTPGPGGPGPAGARRRLGTELRRLRAKTGLPLDDVAAQVPCSTSKLSRLETGKGAPKLRDVHRLIELYRVESETERDMLLRLVHDGRAHGWWEAYTEGLTPERFVMDAPARYTALESDATTVAGYCAVVLHGLVQTADYTHGVLDALLAHRDPAELASLVALRAHRQRALTRPDRPLRLSLVVDEVVLARPVGSAAVMGPQLRRLLTVAERPNVVLRVLPLATPFHRAHIGPFSVLSLGTADDVVYVEGHGGDTYLDGPRDVALYRRVLAEVEAAALDPTASRALIAQWAQRYAAPGAAPTDPAPLDDE